MKKSIKKALAYSSIVALIGLNSIYTVSAAVVFSNSSATYNDWTDTITLQVYQADWSTNYDFSATNASNIKVYNAAWTLIVEAVNSDWNGANDADSSVLNAANGQISITSATLLDWIWAWNFRVVWQNAAWLWAAMFTVWTSNQVNVSATVIPTLTLAVANTTIDLWALSPTAVTSSSTDPTATVTTNALGGFRLYVQDADWNLWLRSASAAHTIANAWVDGVVTATEEEFWIVVSESADPQTNGTIVANPIIAATPTQIASATWPTAWYVASMDVQAAITGITPAAADYTTTLTFTVTGSF